MSSKFWIIALIAAVTALGYWLGRVPPQPAQSPSRPVAVSKPPVSRSAPPQPQPNVLTPNPARPAVPAPPQQALTRPTPVPVPKTYLDSVRPGPERQEAEELALSIRHFGQRFGGNPTGTNAEITQTLNGGNDKRAIYLPANLKRLNEKGELLDPWGTPYFFHSNSATDTEVRSAGPDKVLHTRDDIVTK